MMKSLVIQTRQNGFTLLEVLIALTIFSIAMIGLAGLAGTAIKSTQTGKARTQAINLATEKIEALKKIPYADIQSGGLFIAGIGTRACGGGSPSTCTPSLSPEAVGGRNFTWGWVVTYIDLDNDGNVYSIAPLIDSNDMKRIDVNVSWSDLFGPHTITLSTLRSI